MLVRELIEKLNKMDPEALVVVDGHSDGDAFSTADAPRQIILKEKQSDWSGTHLRADGQVGIVGCLITEF